MLEDAFVVDFTGGGLFATGVVAHLKNADFRPTAVDIGDEVAFGDLLVVDVKEDFATRVIDGLADQICLWRASQKNAGVVRQAVERFQHHYQTRFFENVAASFEQFDHIGRLIIPREF